jgi:hypothetical protein
MGFDRGDIVAHIHLWPSEAGGRASATPSHAFGCLLTMAGRNFDVRLNLSETGPLAPGQHTTVPLRFLDREAAAAYCAVGRSFELREVGVIGTGVIEAVLMAQPAALATH